MKLITYTLVRVMSGANLEDQDETDIFDYIIVGAGAGGATLAYELSRRTDHTILVLESGGPDLDPMIHKTLARRPPRHRLCAP